MTEQTNTAVKPDTIDRLEDTADQAHAMLAGIQLEIFTLLAEGPRTSAELANTLGVAEDRLARLLYALVVTGLLEAQGGRFANMPEAAAFLVKGLPSYRGNHEMISKIWHADLCTAESIRSGKPAAHHDFKEGGDEEMAAMLRGIHPRAVADGRELARRVEFAQYRLVVDVGGGSGGLVATLCDAHPGLRGTLYDLPGTCKLAGPMLRECAGGDHVAIEVGDILAAPPRGTHDAAVLRALVQVLAPADAARAIVNAAAAVRPGGAIYVLATSDLLNDDRLGPPQAVLRNLTFMNLYPAGGSYTQAEYAAWLSAAGCGELERSTMSFTGSALIRATKLR
jgi:O-methyltransferase domain/Dimerisation domain